MEVWITGVIGGYYASKRMNERCERMSQRKSDWPCTYVLIFDQSKPLWMEVWMSGVIGVYYARKRMSEQCN